MSSELTLLIFDSARLLKRSFDARARALGVTRDQAHVLSRLARHEGINQTGFAELIEVEPIPLSRLIDRLTAAGLVYRERDPADRRTRRLYLTRAGWDKLEQLRPVVQSLDIEACSGVPQEELTTARSVIERLIANLASKRQASGADS
ncbi:MAG TPA: MarR family transcriptional regulator [Novosphingobium sp.]|nr:MarR family transcriptional regulator [Novosphingobium sp.]